MGATTFMFILVLLGGLWFIVSGLNMLKRGYQASTMLAAAFGYQPGYWKKKLVA